MFNLSATPFVKETLNEIRRLQQRSRIVMCYPTETECTETGCGHDPVTNSKKKTDCTVCDARGYATTWTKSALVARVVHPEPIAFDFRQQAIIAETGDVIIWIQQRDLDSVKRIRKNERAYLTIDGENYRPSAFTPIGLTGLEEYRVECKKYGPR